MQVHLAEHLPKNERIQLGSYYTPEELVHRVYNFIQHYLDNKKRNVVIFDSAGGCGAFLFGIKYYDYLVKLMQFWG